jgi:hypothetical protein
MFHLSPECVSHQLKKKHVFDGMRKLRNKLFSYRNGFHAKSCFYVLPEIEEAKIPPDGPLALAHKFRATDWQVRSLKCFEVDLHLKRIIRHSHGWPYRMNVAMTSNVEFCRNLVDALQ